MSCINNCTLGLINCSEIKGLNWKIRIRSEFFLIMQDNIGHKVFKCFFYYAADFLEEHRRVLDQRLQPVVREITDSRARTRDELEGTILANIHVYNDL